MINHGRAFLRFFTFVALMLCLLPMALTMAAPAETRVTAKEGSDQAVMEAFTRDPIIEGEAVRIELKQKHQILFFMGVSLLLLILTTAYYGIAMGVYGKQVFVRHMVFAGLAVTLAVAHSIVAIVWFFPF